MFIYLLLRLFYSKPHNFWAIVYNRAILWVVLFLPTRFKNYVRWSSKGGQALYESTIDLTFLKDSQINYMPWATSQYHLFLFHPRAYSKDSCHPRPLKLGHHKQWNYWNLPRLRTWCPWSHYPITFYNVLAVVSMLFFCRISTVNLKL